MALTYLDYQNIALTYLHYQNSIGDIGNLHLEEDWNLLKVSKT